MRLLEGKAVNEPELSAEVTFMIAAARMPLLLFCILRELKPLKSSLICTVVSGLSVPIPISPVVPSIMKADMVVVANVVGDEVAK